MSSFDTTTVNIYLTSVFAVAAIALVLSLALAAAAAAGRYWGLRGRRQICHDR